MRTLTFDQDEFDRPSAEEALELSIALKRFVDSIGRFLPLVVAGLVPQEQAMPLCGLSRLSMVENYLRRFGGLDIPQDCDWPAVVLNDAWDDLDLVIETPEEFIRYHWWTTA